MAEKMDKITKNICNLQIIEILKLHLLETISINQFKTLTNVLDLDEIGIKIRDKIIEEAMKKVNKMKSDSEFDFLEGIENLKKGLREVK